MNNISKKWMKWIPLFTLAALCIGFAGGGAATKAETAENHKIADGVYIGNVYVGGMTEEEAVDAISAYAQSVDDAVLTLNANGKSVEVSAQELGITFQNTNAVQEALAVGRNGNLIKRYKDKKDLEHGSKVFELPLGLNETAAREVLTAKAEKLNNEAVDNGLIRENGQFQFIEGSSGVEVNVEKSLMTIEDYLKKVVPSEMPVSFGVNALKCQAVCARSYAYTQLTNNYYSEYGAHIDDSVSFQVYNNTYDSAESDEAVIATAGMVAVYNGELVKTYYYSTSCGYTADVCAWGSDEDNYPQYASVRAGTSDYNADIKSEKTFEQFITAKDSSDYDSEADMYRWKTVIGISELTAHFNSLIGSYLRKNGSVYILENGEPSDKVVNDIGNIASVKVIERGCGGVVAALMVEGSKETCIVKGENAVRSLMGNNKCAIITQSREIYNDILPSAFCIFKPVYDNGTLVSYEITGGGYGHGIGMSQNAVKKMSETMDYTDILKFFYNNIEIKNIND